MREDEEGSITDANNITADTFSFASISQRKKFEHNIYKLEAKKSDELVNVVNNLTINDAEYELNIATASDTKGDLMSFPDTVTHTSNRI